MAGRHSGIGPHFYRNLDADSCVVVRLPLRDLAERIEGIDGGTPRLLRCLVEVRRETLAGKVASRRSSGKEDVAQHLEHAGDVLAAGVEALLIDLSGHEVSIGSRGIDTPASAAGRGLVVELSFRELAERIQGLNYGTQRFLSHLVDVRREHAKGRVDPLVDRIEALLREGLY